MFTLVLIGSIITLNLTIFVFNAIRRNDMTESINKNYIMLRIITQIIMITHLWRVLQLSKYVLCFRYWSPASDNFATILLTSSLWSVSCFCVFYTLSFFSNITFFHAFILAIIAYFYGGHFIEFLSSLHLFRICSEWFVWS